MGEFVRKLGAQNSANIWIVAWFLAVLFIALNIGPSSVTERPKLSGAIISQSLPPRLEEEWKGTFEPGNVDVVSTENGQTAVSGWMGPLTGGVWIRAESESSLTFEPFNRPDVEQALGWNPGEAYGYSFSISQVNVTCIWHLGDGGPSLRYSRAGALCGGG